MHRAPTEPLRKRARLQPYPVVVLPGNHDIGLPKGRGGPRDEHSLAWHQFMQGFAMSVNEDFTVADTFAPARSMALSWNARLQVAVSNDSVPHELLFVNAQDLIGIEPLGSPSFATMAKVASAGQRHAPDTTRFVTQVGHSVRDDAPSTYSRVLFSHVPLARAEGEHGCNIPERSSYHRVYRESQHARAPGGGIAQGGGLNTTYQNLLLPDVSRWILSELQPSLVFSGDDHDHCETVHKSSRNATLSRGGVTGFERTDVPELTVKSMSMLEGVRRPGFARLQLNGNANAEQAGSIAYRPCLLPDQIALWLYVYVPCFLTTVMLLCWRTMKVSSRSTLPTHSGDDAHELYPLESGRTSLLMHSKTRCKAPRISPSRILSDIVVVALVPLPLWLFLQFT